MPLVPRTELDELLPRDGMVYAPRYDELDEPLTPVLIAGPRDELLVAEPRLEELDDETDELLTLLLYPRDGLLSDEPRRDELLELMFEAAWLDPRYPAELDGREFGRYT